MFLEASVCLKFLFVQLLKVFCFGFNENTFKSTVCYMYKCTVSLTEFLVFRIS